MEKREVQMEALEVLEKFNPRLIVNIEYLVDELSGQKKKDTNELLASVIDSINWEMTVLNETLSCVNEGKERIDKEKMNNCLENLGKALQGGNEAATADAFKALLPEFRNIGQSIREFRM